MLRWERAGPRARARKRTGKRREAVASGAARRPHDAIGSGKLLAYGWKPSLSAASRAASHAA
jgi:hypothetical protein